MNKQLEQLPIPLLEWFSENARVLPWREDPTPYHVWLSEVMLQQTRVAAVLGYYERMLRECPTVADLAALEEDRLMKLWQGLGYYSRARSLHRAAKLIVEEYHGEFPTEHSAIRALPGVGDYTAGAICSIAFGIPVPAVDGNVLRVVARITGDDTDITTPAMKKKVTAALQEIIPVKAPGTFNQALMELGAGLPAQRRAPVRQMPRRTLLRGLPEGSDRPSARQGRKKSPPDRAAGGFPDRLPSQGRPAPPREARPSGRTLGVSQRAVSCGKPCSRHRAEPCARQTYIYPCGVAHDRPRDPDGGARAAGGLDLGGRGGAAPCLCHSQRL